MWRRLNREDFVASNALTDERRLHHPFKWTVYETYELVRQGPEDAYFRALDGTVRHYEPLVETPHLFLEFARIAERDDQSLALEEWIAKYGLLGLGRQEQHRFRDGDLPEVEKKILSPSHGAYRPEGGPNENYAAVLEEAQVANEVLVLYEGALSRDTEKLEQALMERFQDSVEDLREYCRLKVKLAKGASYTAVLVHLATQLVFWLLQEVLEEFAYPCIAVDLPPWKIEGLHPIPPDPLYTPQMLYPAWQPRNLLGALYIQVYWLVTSTGKLSRCKQCGRIIAYTTPIPGSGERKPRKDKEFCDERCRQNYHYHHRVKPTRQSQRKRTGDQ